MREEALFLRKSSGLVRTWGIIDAFIYNASMAPPLMQAAYVWSLAAFWPTSNIILAILLMTIFEIFHAIYYSGVISTMPRAGGEYVWTTRLLSAPLGFCIVFTGWLVVLPVWIPVIVANITQQSIAPLFYIAGNTGTANWVWTNDGLFVLTLINIVYSFLACAFGMKLYSRIQKIIFPLAIIGTIVAIISFALATPENFVTKLNSFYHDTLGYPTTNFYQDTIDAATGAGLAMEWNWDVGQALPLIPLLAYYGIWGVWSAPLMGEVRQADRMNKVLGGLLAASVPINLLGLVFLLPVLRLVGFNFYTSGNWLWWMADIAHAPIPPAPGLWLYLVTGSVPLAFFVLFFNAWTALHFNGGGNGYLAVSRMMFAMSFDRMLPSWFASLSTKFRVPMVSMIWTAILATIYGWLYAYDIRILEVGFRVLFLDGVIVLVFGFISTAIIAVILPYKRRQLWEASTASKWTSIIQGSALIYLGFLGMLLYYYVVDPLYGSNNPTSALFLGTTYILGIITYVAFRYYRKSQGIDMSKLYGTIPVE